MQNNTLTVPILLSIGDLGGVLGLGPKAIYKRLQENPDLLPPRIILPGSNLHRWHPEVVRRWLDERAGLVESTSPPPYPTRRRPGRPTKKEQIERARQGGAQ